MARKSNAPARDRGAADRKPGGCGSQNGNNRAENLGSNVVAFGRVPRCPICSWFVPPGSATEKLHHQRCVVRRRRQIDRLKIWDRQQRWKRLKRWVKAEARRL